MGAKKKWLFAAAAVAALGLLGAAAAFTIRWSAPCEEELADAEAAWRAYAAHVEGTPAGDDARAVADALPDDLAGAIDASEGVLITPPPGDAEASRLYRAANEALSLASGACADNG